MNTTPISRPYGELSQRYPAIVLEVMKSIDRVATAFQQSFPGALPRHRAMLYREWASLASVPFAVIESFKFSGAVCAEDGRRIVGTESVMIVRITEVKAGTSAPPDWAQGHRAVSPPLRLHSC
jgi:hypothetical protein